MGAARNKYEKALPLEYYAKQKRTKRFIFRKIIMREMRLSGETRGEVVARIHAGKATSSVQWALKQVRADHVDTAIHRGIMRGLRRDEAELDNEIARQKRVAEYLDLIAQ